MLIDSLLIIVYLHRILVVRGQRIEVLRGTMFLYYFVVVGGLLREVKSLLVCRIKNRFLRLGVLFDFLNG